MNGFQRELLAPRDIQVNQGITEDHINDDYNLYELGPGDFYDFVGGAAYQRIAVGRWSVLMFPANGAASIAFAIVRRRKFWVKGNLRCRVSYSGSVGSTNNAIFGAQPVPLATGGLLSTIPGPLFSPIPGPSVADALAPEFVFSQLVPVDASHRVISVQLFRDDGHAGDTYTGDFYVTHVLLEYIPMGQSV